MIWRDATRRVPTAGAYRGPPGPRVDAAPAAPYLAGVPLLSDTYTSAAACLLVRRADGAVLAVRGPRGTGFPGGKREPGESPLACALREAAEECGVDLRGRLADAHFLGEHPTSAGHPVALVWHPPLEGDAAELGPPTREGAPAWVQPADLCSPTHGRHPDWNEWALRTARDFERDPAAFDTERACEPDLEALLRDAAEARARRARPAEDGDGG